MGKNLAGPTIDLTKVSSSLFVVLFEISSNFLIINFEIIPLNIRNNKKFQRQLIFEIYLLQEFPYSILTKKYQKNYLLFP